MKNHILCLSLFMLLFSHSSIYGQDPTQGEDFILNSTTVVPPSPNQAALFKFQDIPVSKSTGIPNISIPIWSINQGNLSAPISLSYHAGGIRANEEASLVGLAWALNAGGVVSRTMMGKPDDFGNGFLALNHYGLLPTDFIYPNDHPDDNITVKNILDGNWDGSPDMFQFSLPGLSGKFFFGHDGNAYTVPYSKVRITPLGFTIGGGTINQWEITNVDGTRYILGPQSEETIVESECAGSMNINLDKYKSSWFLQSMISPDGLDTLHFEYEATYVHPVEVQHSETQYYSLNPSSLCGVKNPSYCVNKTFHEGRTLTKIKSRHFEVILSYTNGREDVADAYASQTYATPGSKLSTIIVRNIQTQERLHKYAFTYDYYNANSPSFNEKRLRLRAIQEFGVDDLHAKPPFTFDYKDDVLPPKDTKAIDHWGYFNGATSNQTLIPTVWQGSQKYPAVGDGANRSVDPAFAQTGILNKITYPTGGYTAFTYESNDYGHAHFKNDERDDIVQQQYYIAFHDDYVDGNGNLVYAQGGYNSTCTTFGTSGCSHEVPFTINPNPKNPQAELFLEFEDVTFWNTQIAGDWAGGYLAIENAGRREVFRIEGGSSVNPDFHLYLPPGDYFLKATAYMNGEAMSGRLKVQEIVVDTVQAVAVFGEKAGGLRIKEIHTFSDQHVSAFKKRFSYTHTVDGISYSSGTLGAEPRYHYTFQESAVDPTIGGGNTSGSGVGGTPATINSCNYAGEFFNPCYYFVTNSSPLNLQGGVQYHTVTEEQLDAQDQPNGKTVSQFTSFIDQPNRGYYYMFPTNFTSYDWRRGLPITQKVYDQHGVLLRESNTTYLFSADSTNGYAFGMGLPNVHASRGIMAKLKFDSGCTYQPYTCEAEDVLDYSNFAGLVVRQVGSGIFENQNISGLPNSWFNSTDIPSSSNTTIQISRMLAVVEEIIADAGITTYTRPQRPPYMTEYDFYYKSFQIKISPIKIDSIFGIRLNIPIGHVPYVQLAPYNEIDLCNYRPVGHIIVPEPRTKYYYHQYDLISEWVYPKQTVSTTFEGGQTLTSTVDFLYDNPSHAQLTRTVTSNSDGEVYVTKAKYPLDYIPSLNLNDDPGVIEIATVEELTEKNIVASVIEQQLWIGSSLNDLKLYKGKIQTFQELTHTFSQSFWDWKDIKPSASYLLETETGLSPGFEDVDSTTGLFTELIPSDSYTKRVAYEWTSWGNLMSESFISGQQVSYLNTGPNRLVTAQILNADSGAYAFTSFEKSYEYDIPYFYNWQGNWDLMGSDYKNGYSQQGQYNQTGQYSYQMRERNTGNERFIQKVNTPPGTYTISFWYHGDPIDIKSTGEATQIVPINTSSLPTYVELEVQVSSGGVIEISTTGISYIDELRLYPVDAQMTTYCYDEALRLHTKTDANNRSTYYHYDELGQLQYVQDQEGHYVQGYEYNYKN